jgi:hypothetical protein
VEVSRAPTAVYKQLNAENKTPLPSWKSSIISLDGDVAAVFIESDSALNVIFIYFILNTMGQPTTL